MGDRREPIPQHGPNAGLDELDELDGGAVVDCFMGSMGFMENCIAIAHHRANSSVLLKQH